MYKLVNGEKMEMTAEEIAVLQEETKLLNAVRQNQPMTESEVARLLIAQQINTLAVDDNTALRMREFYPDWAAGQDYPAGFKVQRGGALYKVLQAHTSQSTWVPGAAGTESLYARIDEEHDGTQYDPIPYEGNMALENGKYYTQGGVLYRGTRDTGNPVYHALSELVGIYVEVVSDGG